MPLLPSPTSQRVQMRDECRGEERPQLDEEDRRVTVLLDEEKLAMVVLS